eukprot:m.47698 g.47698  ORF g.47698 m.47698 type:complete len:273 (-) comp13240_c0_seq10:1619-2437(-)
MMLGLCFLSSNEHNERDVTWLANVVLALLQARDLNHDKYKLTMVSPRDHMLFTPLLASTTVGTLEHRSIIEPVRPSAAKNGWRYLQAEATAIDFATKTVSCTYSQPVFSEDRSVNLTYDKLVVGIGAVPNTFGVPGVIEHAFFLKEAEDGRAIRRRIHDCLEAASDTTLPEQTRQELTNFVVVGGGPTGVEFAAELTDFLRQDCTRLYPEVGDMPRIHLLEAGHGVLSSFDSQLADHALKKLRQQDCDVRLEESVREVRTCMSVHLSVRTRL